MATTFTEHLQIPKHSPTDPFNIALINEGFDKTEAGILAAYRGRAAYNLLDNSNFKNVINQRGVTTTGEWTTCIDRWISKAAGVGLSFGNNGMTVNGVIASGNALYQKLEKYERILGKAVTLAVKHTGSDKPIILNCTLPSAITTNAWTTYASKTVGNVMLDMFSSNGALATTFAVANQTSVTFEWIALYEGTYTEETLPPYVPKGYAAEFAECQRYYRKYSTIQLPLTITTAAWGAAAIDYTGMRVTPTPTYNLEGVYVGGTKYTSITSITTRVLPASELVINIGSSVAANQTGTIRFNSLALSADL